MLDGITVLETISEPSVSAGSAAWSAIVGAIIVIIFVINCIQSIKSKSYKGVFGDETIGKTFAIVCDVMVVAAIIFGCVNMCQQTNTIITKYRASIDESVSLVEFNERYEILQKDGDEYIIMEIERTGE